MELADSSYDCALFADEAVILELLQDGDESFRRADSGAVLHKDTNYPDLYIRGFAVPCPSREGIRSQTGSATKAEQ